MSELKMFCFSISLALLLSACDQPSNSAPQHQKANLPVTTQTLKTDFNNTDKDIAVNGNIVVAANKVQKISPEELWKQAQPIAVADMTKKIYATIGKPLKIKGKVYKVEELPPAAFGLAGTWTEVLILTRNVNAPMDVSTIDYLYKGDSSDLNSGNIIEFSGYLAGSYESQNAMGGAIEAFVLVGNNFKKL